MTDYFLVSLIFIVTVGSACVVAFSRNLIYSAFALVGSFMGVAGTFIYLNAVFVGLAQVVVYVGGILVLTIFAVMLTTKIEDKSKTNPVFNTKIVVPLLVIFIFLLVQIITTDSWKISLDQAQDSSIAAIGNHLLTTYLLPFELVSVLLLVAMIGAAVITRRHVK